MKKSLLTGLVMGVLMVVMFISTGLVCGGEQETPSAIKIVLTVDGEEINKEIEVKMPDKPDRVSRGAKGDVQIFKFAPMRVWMPDGLRFFDMDPVLTYDPAFPHDPYTFSDMTYNNRNYGYYEKSDILPEQNREFVMVENDATVPPPAGEIVPCPVEKWNDLSRFEAKVLITTKGKNYKLQMVTYTACFDGDTKIRVLGGDEIRIRELTSGEYVLNPITGKPVKIAVVIKGPEAFDMYSITAGDHHILLTRDHPVPTRTGFKTARQLTTSDELLTEALSWRKIDTIESAKAGGDGRVYNLRFNTDTTDSEEHVITANGLVMGDHSLQERMSKGESPEALVIPIRNALTKK